MGELFSPHDIRDQHYPMDHRFSLCPFLRTNSEVIPLDFSPIKNHQRNHWIFLEKDLPTDHLSDPLYSVLHLHAMLIQIWNRHRLYNHMVLQPEWSQNDLNSIPFRSYPFFLSGFYLKIKTSGTEEPTNNINNIYWVLVLC